MPSAERTPLLIACGYHHCACVFSSGEILSWSAHALGGQPTLQLHAPPAGSAFTQLACGGSSTAAIAVVRERPDDGAGVVHAGLLQPPLTHNTKRQTPPSCGRSPPQHRVTPPGRSVAPSTSNAGLRATLSGPDAYRGSPSTDRADTTARSNSPQTRFAAPHLSTPPPAGCIASLSPGPRTPPPPLDESLSPRLTVVQPPLDAWCEVNSQSTGPVGRVHRLEKVIPTQSHSQNMHGELQDQLQARACPNPLGLRPQAGACRRRAVPTCVRCVCCSARRSAVLTRKTVQSTRGVVRNGRNTRPPPRTYEQARWLTSSQPRDRPWWMPELSRGSSSYRRYRPHAQKRHASERSCSKRNVSPRSSQRSRWAVALAALAALATLAPGRLNRGW